MAYTKVFAIKRRLDKSVAYAANEKKTGLGGMIEYVVNRNKTEQRLFESALNCESPKTAYKEMQATKKRWKKQGGVLGYHFIQSFAPGEVTPEQAHQIGVEFARRMFGERYEVVIGTHLDKHHLHNHIVINSVSCMDGKKYHSSPESYYNSVRVVSDSLCRENELSVIQPQGKGKHYAEWKAEQQGKPTIRGMIRADIDEIIDDAFTYKSFLDLLKRRGYEVKSGPNIKHTAVRPPGGEKFIRLDSLGDGYTEAEIKARLSGVRQEKKTQPPAPRPIKTYRLRGSYRSIRRRKLTGLRALYYRYLYLLGAVKHTTARKKTPFSRREELLKFDRYQRQFRFLCEYHIDTIEELSMLSDAIQADVDTLTDHRKELYKERRAGDESVSDEITEITARLRVLRRAQRTCGTIQTDIHNIQRMSKGMGGREIQSKARSKTHEKTHKARHFDPAVPHGGVPPGGRRQH